MIVIGYELLSDSKVTRSEWLVIHTFKWYLETTGESFLKGYQQLSVDGMVIFLSIGYKSPPHCQLHRSLESTSDDHCWLTKKEQ